MKLIKTMMLISLFHFGTFSIELKAGEVIAYSVTYSNNTNKLFSMNSDGSNTVQLGNLAGRPLSPEWSPDASKIVYYNHLSQQSWQLFIMDSNGTNSQTLLQSSNTLDWSPSFSPNGQKVLFTRSITTPIWKSELWEINADGSNPHKIVSVNGQGGVYSPDGSEIVFFDYVEGGGDIWKMDSDGANISKLTLHHAEDWWPDWSPDGKKIVFQSKRDGNFEIYILELESGSLTRLTNNNSDDEEPKWSPDGKKIAFSSLRDGHYEIYTMNADGTNQTRLTNVNGNAINPNWRPQFDLPYLGQVPPNHVPKRFTPDSLCATNEWQYHGTPTFSPDGKEMYFPKAIYSPFKNEICFTECINGKWTQAKTAPFSQNSYANNNPYFLRHKDTLFFISQRPTGFIYKVIRTNGVWSSPVKLNLPVPSGHYYGLQFSIANNGNVYSELTHIQSGSEDIYVWKYENGQYNNPEKLSSICSPQLDFTPYIDPEERFILFSSRRPGGYGATDIYMSKRNQDNTWSAPVNLGTEINSGTAISPIISNDGLYLFYGSMKEGDLGLNTYWVDAKVVYDHLTNLEDETSLPEEIYLNQNYPNPFNPSTNISYTLPFESRVSLKIYGVLGNEVVALISEYQNAGQHEISYNASHLAGGVYFYTLRTENFTQTKKMLLLK